MLHMPPLRGYRNTMVVISSQGFTPLAIVCRRSAALLLRVCMRRHRRQPLLEVGGQVVDVALKHNECIVVASGVNSLGQVDDNGSRGVNEYVVFGQIAVDDAGAEHANDLCN